MTADNKMRIEPGKYVELGYDLYQVAADGTKKLVHQTDPEDPERIVFGVTQGLIESFAKAIEGLTEGDTFEVGVKADEAFGERNPEHVVELDRNIFLVDGKFDDEMIKKGNAVPMMTADGFRMMGMVVDVTPKKVIMDFNHPLAGKDIFFSGKVLLVRDATEDELHPQAGCGCGGGCNCGEGCDCGEGCSNDGSGCGGCK